MQHLSEEELTLFHYGDAVPEDIRHLERCPDCRSAFVRTQSSLNELPEYRVPAPSPGWEIGVWNRLVPRLQERPDCKPSSRRLWFLLAPAGAILALGIFIGGMLTQHHIENGISAEASARVLELSISGHLDRSEILLTDFVNGGPDNAKVESAEARDLLTENRLLRQTAVRAGDTSRAMLLDELERALLDIVHAGPEPLEVVAAQQRLRSGGLLFKIRILNSTLRQKEQRL